MRTIRRILSLMWVVSLAAFVLAQGNYRAQLRGVVTDASGAVVAHASVTIRDVGTNIASTAPSDHKGWFFFTGLPPSTYAVKVEAPGFRAAEKTGVVLAVDQESSLNFRLEIGGVSTTIDVTTTAPLLETTMEPRHRNHQRICEGTPAPSRNFFGMAFLPPASPKSPARERRTTIPPVPISFPTGSATPPPRSASMAPSSARPNREKEELQRLLRAPGRERAGIQGPEQQLLRRIRQQRRHRRQHGPQERHQRLPRQRLVFPAALRVDARDFFIPRPMPSQIPSAIRTFSLGGPIRKNKTFFFVDISKKSAGIYCD